MESALDRTSVNFKESANLVQTIARRLAEFPTDGGIVMTSSTDGIVTLNGNVPTYALRASVENFIRGIDGVRGIRNHLIVAHDYCLRDDALLGRVRNELARKPDIDSSNIEVEAHHGVVTLRGTVQSIRDKTAVEDTVRMIEGILGIECELAVTPLHTSSDCRLANAIVAAIEKDFGVEAIQIRVFVKDGRVVLRGVLDSTEKIKKCVRIVEQVEGVVRVRNRLRPLILHKNGNCDLYGHPIESCVS